MLSRIIREILFCLVHLVITVLVALKTIYLRFRTTREHFSRSEVTTSDIKLILKYTPNLKKKIHHLVILADAHNHTVGDLARLVIWSLVAGVPFLSFYDITGDLVNNEEQLFLEVEKKKVGIPGCIKWMNKPDLNGYTNGFLAHTIQVNIHTRREGRPTIANCIRKVANNEVPSNQKSSEMTADEFDKCLSYVYPMIPEPDLVLYTGPVCCTYGLLPWHIRLTEFIQLSTNYNFNVQSYLVALLRFDKCDFRFGK